MPLVACWGSQVEAWVPGAFDVFGEGKNHSPSTVSVNVTLEHELRESVGSFRVEFMDRCCLRMKCTDLPLKRTI